MRAAVVTVVGMTCLLPGPFAQAGSLNETGDVGMDEVSAGQLLLPSAAPGRYRRVPLLHTDVHLRINGMVADVQVTQRFHNPGDEWVEGIYVFPLPGESAVHKLRMHVGQRVVEGVVQEKTAAKRTYETAKRTGRKASLVEQERPNIFTTSVANIGPGDDVIVELHYAETLRYADGGLRIRFPLVVGPRYIPGQVITENAALDRTGRGWASDTNLVPDASRITPPVLRPDAGPINPVSIQVELDAGFALARFASSYHSMQFERVSEGVLRGRLSEDTHADRDFELVWEPALGKAPRAALFGEERDGQHYVSLMVTPPDSAGAQNLAMARELVMVIDTSGSMHGLSIQQAVAATRYALRQLGPDDAVNLIEFNSTTEALFPRPRLVTAGTLQDAHAFLDRLRARGGTEMAPALQAALAGAPENGRVRQVVFLTDGSVGNERQLFEIIESNLGRSRLFTVGIGSAPNSFFMRRAAEAGRGTFTYIGKLEEVQGSMAELFSKIRFPVVTDIRLAWPGAGDTECWPGRLPDLHHGEPLLVSCRLQRVSGDAVIEGRLGDRPWRFALASHNVQAGHALSTLWARAKIKSLLDRQFGGQSSDEIRKTVVDLGIKFHLITRYTSLVAVDVTPSRPDTEALRSRAMPTNLPHGWSYDHVFGGMPRTATDAAWQLPLALLLILLAALIWRWSGRTACARQPS